ncbi:Hypothetical protein R9X50_00703500 [Acrodontium crateriforme]|uniref:AMMECR1 domain-containing protein n=1 Tax=Acrodontium crateriforme TaxID=150365 RepID=A0AAQ3M9Z0_9PEZI|nr:Hypothetical protein R9X50_00703500 [Acrodontium crateriforme]
MVHSSARSTSFFAFFILSSPRKMATPAHCAFCFETLAANFEHRRSLSLAQVEELWDQYHATQAEDEDEDDEQDVEAESEQSHAARPAAISRLLNRDSATSSNSSLPSSESAASSTPSAASSSGEGTPASASSSRTSLFSIGKKSRDTYQEHPLFVTWNTVSRSGHKSLRGCIGTFEPLELENGLRSYSLTSALDDVRFSPIPASLLPSLSAHVTLLTNFSASNKDPMNWVIGKNGLRISFTHRGRRYGSTYLPDVAPEQGWTKEETVISLMRKAGWNGSTKDWEKTWREGNGALVTYEGKQVGLLYEEYKSFRDWVTSEGIQAKGSN